jgi:hypothetical protein
MLPFAFDALRELLEAWLAADVEEERIEFGKRVL